ncbi:MAG: hypothetical protein ACJASJ_000734 [Candidatus Azotimanducaceae bacterium]|jgi:hypothetical protein
MMTMPWVLDLAAGRVKVASVPDDRVSERSLDVDSAFAVPTHKTKMQILSRPQWASLCGAWRLQFFIEGICADEL